MTETKRRVIGLIVAAMVAAAGAFAASATFPATEAHALGGGATSVCCD